MEKFNFKENKNPQEENKNTQEDQEQKIEQELKSIKENLLNIETEKKQAPLNNIMKRDVADMKSYIMQLHEENRITIPYALNKALNDFGYKNYNDRELLKKIILEDFKESKKIKALEKRFKELEEEKNKLKPKKPTQLGIDFPED
jgi:hypothetical protein